MIKIASIDGFGEPDWAGKEYDKSQSDILDNKAKFFTELDVALQKSTESADQETGIPISQLVFEAIEKGVSRILIAKKDIYYDVDFFEAFEDALIRLGLGSEDYVPHIEEHNWQIEITF